MDILEPIGENGNTTNCEHVRMKGIPTPCIKHYAEEIKLIH